jgi:hypothetical protein
MPDDTPPSKPNVKERKPMSEKRLFFLRVRLTEEQDILIKAAAKTAGITVSAWAQERLTRVARQERRRAAEEQAPTADSTVGAPPEKPL